MHKGHKDFDLVIENKIANQVIGIAIEIHKKLGPGLLESVYQDCLYYKIEQSGLIVEREKVLPIVFEEMKIDSGYRVDLLVEKKVRRYSQ